MFYIIQLKAKIRNLNVHYESELLKWRPNLTLLYFHICFYYLPFTAIVSLSLSISQTWNVLFNCLKCSKYCLNTHAHKHTHSFSFLSLHIDFILPFPINLATKSSNDNCHISQFISLGEAIWLLLNHNYKNIENVLSLTCVSTQSYHVLSLMVGKTFFILVQTCLLICASSVNR